MDRALLMREAILSAEECSFQAEITADYGDNVQVFTLSCISDKQGNLSFSVISPDTISGISGTIDEVNGKLKFDQTMLAFPLLVDGQLSPVSAPWIMMHSLRSGYLSAAGDDETHTRISINDSFADCTMQLEVWIDENLKLVQVEYIWDGRRILTARVSNFEFR